MELGPSKYIQPARMIFTGIAMIKILLICLVIFMIFNLFKALYLMNKNEPGQPSMSKYIGRRLMFSVLIVLVVLIGLATGVIQPNPSPF